MSSDGPGCSTKVYVQSAKTGVDSLDVVFRELVRDKGEIQGEAKSPKPRPRTMKTRTFPKLAANMTAKYTIPGVQILC